MPHSNLSHFRARLIVHELEGWAFDRFLEIAEEARALDPGEAHREGFREATVVNLKRADSEVLKSLTTQSLQSAPAG